MFYTINEDVLIVLLIWDNRRDPKEVYNLLREFN